MKIAIIDIQGIDSEISRIKFVEQLEDCLAKNDEINVYFLITTSVVPVPYFQIFCYQTLLAAKETYKNLKKIWLVGVNMNCGEEANGIFEYAKLPGYSYKFDEIIELPSFSNYKYHTKADAAILNWLLYNTDLIFTCHYKHITLSICDKILSQYMSECSSQIFNLISTEIEGLINNYADELPVREKEILHYYDLGWSYNRIGQIYSLSGARIRQIILQVYSKVRKRIC